MNIPSIVLAPLVAVWILSVSVVLSASPLLLYLEYKYRLEPDTYGWSQSERLTSAARTLAAVTDLTGSTDFTAIRLPGTQAPLYTPSEINHLHDVKTITDIIHSTAVFTTALLGIYAYYAYVNQQLDTFFKSIRSTAWRVIITLAVIALYILISWQQFFITFHRLLFRPGTWTFAVDSSLIRLFPEQFWIDYTSQYLGLVMTVSMLLIVISKIKLSRVR